MQKILNAKQIREWDANTITHEPIASIDLMERACRGVVNWIVERFDAGSQIGVVCGTGNNGGDGLGVARLLKEWGFPVRVWIIPSDNPSLGFLENKRRLPAVVRAQELKSADDLALDGLNVVIDAIFGSGLNKPVTGLYEEVIKKINVADVLRIAIDVPSGLPIDQPLEGSATHAHHTLTFQIPKLSFFFPESFQYTGEWHVIDIGLDKNFIKSAETNYHFVTRNAARKMIRKRSKFSHKGDFGKALLAAGSTGKTGAAILAARGALRAGVGLLTVHIPTGANTIIQTAVPEAMTLPDGDQHMLSTAQPVDAFDVVGIGPGIGQNDRTATLLYHYLERNKPMVLDADALNILSKHPDWRRKIPLGSILTPHPGEMERLTGLWRNDFHRLELQRQLAAEMRSIVVLKGAYTSICTPEGSVYFNSTGNPGMATGGAGDVLTGIITSLLAQQYSAELAAILGVFLHGLSGDLAAREKGQYSLIATDLVDYLPAAFQSLKG